MVWTLPNLLTVARIALAPAVAVLPFAHGYLPKLIAFIVFLTAAISDIYDGRIARERGEITDLGKLLDPLADKLLLVAALVPIYWLTRAPDGVYAMPWWGGLPVWVAAVLVGREVAMTLVRQFAKRRGVVIAAAGAGKAKTILQNVFIGAAILWLAWKDLRSAFSVQSSGFGAVWETLHGTVTAIALAGALVLTIYSLGVYMYRYRDVIAGRDASSQGLGNGR